MTHTVARSLFVIQGNYEKNCYSPDLRYVFSEYAFTFTFASWEFLPTCGCFIVCDSIIRLYVTLIFDLLTSKQIHDLPVVMCFHHANVGLSVLELGRGTRQTDRQTGRRTNGQADTGYHFIMSPPYGGRGITKTVGKIDNIQNDT